MNTAAEPTTSIPGGTASTHPYTCNTCQVAFRGSQQQRTHMQSDWHRYNLKRRVASLPPLSSEIFNEKVIANQATAAATAAKATFEKVCGPCQRTYYSENAYQNHLNSQKHKIRVIQLAGEATTEDDATSMTSSVLSLGDPLASTDGDMTPTGDDTQSVTSVARVTSGLKKTSLANPTEESSEEEEEDEEDEEASKDVDKQKAQTTCLFCNIASASPAANITHMRATHSMFIPEQAYLVDLAGLLDYLHTRVRGLHECLYCGHAKHTTAGIQTHMRDKGHCMIGFESEEQMVEVGQFYDFRSTYSDDEDDEDSEEDEQWVDDDSEEDLQYNYPTELSDIEDGAEPRVIDKTLPRKPRAPAYFDEDGLHLPSGRVAGHRSFARYFRQNLHSYPTAEERVSRRLAIEDGSAEPGAELGVIRPARRERPGALTRANGGTGLTGVSDQKRKELRATELKDEKRARRQQARYAWGNEKRANNQKHFRDPLLQ